MKQIYYELGHVAVKKFKLLGTTCPDKENTVMRLVHFIEDEEDERIIQIIIRFCLFS